MFTAEAGVCYKLTELPLLQCFGCHLESSSGQEGRERPCLNPSVLGRDAAAKLVLAVASESVCCRSIWDRCEAAQIKKPSLLENLFEIN